MGELLWSGSSLFSSATKITNLSKYRYLAFKNVQGITYTYDKKSDSILHFLYLANGALYVDTFAITIDNTNETIKLYNNTRATIDTNGCNISTSDQNIVSIYGSN